MSVRILVVDDSPVDLEFHATILRDAGFLVQTAPDTRSAMEIFMREDLDLVLLDFALDETDGGILAFEMRRRRPSIRLAFLCGEPDSPMPRHLVDAVIAKSQDPREIVLKVQRLLNNSASMIA